MKALSLKQPYAELILQGRKKIELRKWNTNFRGDFLIHSSLIPDKAAMRKFGFNELPLGFIVGKANLADVKKYENDSDFKKDKSLHLANRDFGGYGFMLKDIKRTELIPAKGQLNFWNFELK
ncbi:ASCH domain-containing protein [Candidatus Pacearchaeota archaeon]|nr:ASCH domain-containing protein [Candidatus Pacearchaeota archaeon]